MVRTRVSTVVRTMVWPYVRTYVRTRVQYTCTYVTWYVPWYQVRTYHGTYVPHTCTRVRTYVRTYVYNITNWYLNHISWYYSMVCHNCLIGKGHIPGLCALRTTWEDTQQPVERGSECRATHTYTLATVTYVRTYYTMVHVYQVGNVMSKTYHGTTSTMVWPYHSVRTYHGTWYWYVHVYART
jgi:hypothetical protein